MSAMRFFAVSVTLWFFVGACDGDEPSHAPVTIVYENGVPRCDCGPCDRGDGLDGGMAQVNVTHGDVLPDTDDGATAPDVDAGNDATVSADTGNDSGRDADLDADDDADADAGDDVWDMIRCGDGICLGPEVQVCPLDCPRYFCGDGNCAPGEDSWNCWSDCGCPSDYPRPCVGICWACPTGQAAACSEQSGLLLCPVNTPNYCPFTEECMDSFSFALWCEGGDNLLVYNGMPCE